MPARIVLCLCLLLSLTGADLDRQPIGGVAATRIALDPAAWRVAVVAAGDLDRYRARSRVVIVNAGYFDEAQRPIGLLADATRTVHAAGDAAVLSGLFSIAADGSAAIRRGATVPARARLAIQSGPLLVEPDGSLGIRSGSEARRRTVLAVRDGRLSVIATGPIGLRPLAEHLVAERYAAAINLDGGPSTSLWARLEGNSIEDPPTAEVPWFIVWWQD
jgi:uncharacterized protein YigE (DUF2233 family)